MRTAESNPLSAVRPSFSEHYSDAYEVQTTAKAEFKDAVFTLNVEALDGFDQVERHAIRRAAQRAQEWNDAHASENLPRPGKQG